MIQRRQADTVIPSPLGISANSSSSDHTGPDPGPVLRSSTQLGEAIGGRKRRRTIKRHQAGTMSPSPLGRSANSSSSDHTIPQIRPKELYNWEKPSARERAEERYKDIKLTLLLLLRMSANSSSSDHTRPDPRPDLRRSTQLEEAISERKRRTMQRRQVDTIPTSPLGISANSSSSDQTKPDPRPDLKSSIQLGKSISERKRRTMQRRQVDTIPTSPLGIARVRVRVTRPNQTPDQT